MNRIIVFIIIFVITFTSFAQKSAFVLIDVSGNPLDLQPQQKITKQLRIEAIDLVRDIITAEFDSNKYVNWEKINLQGELKNIYYKKGNPLISNDGFLVIMPYGERETYKDFRINKIQNFPTDFYNFYNYAYSFKYRDQLTFEEIAEAKAADIALDPMVGINKYYLITIKGLGGDKTGSQPYSEEELDYIKSYVVDLESLGGFSLINPDKQYSINIRLLDVSKMDRQSNIVKQPNIGKKVLEIISPKGTKRNPFETEEEKNFRISWTCFGCLDSTTYRVYVRGNKTKSYTVSNKNYYTLQLGKGDYRISVSGDGVSSKNNVYIKIKGKRGGYGFLVFLFVLLILAAIAFYFWKVDPFGWQKNKSKTGNKTSNEEFFNTQESPSSDAANTPSDTDYPSFS